MSDLPTAFRPYQESDESFLFSSWLRSFRMSNMLRVPTSRQLPMAPTTADVPTGPALWEHDLYFKNQRALITNVLKSSTTTMLVNPEDPDQVYGFVVWRDLAPEVRVVSYLYVKNTFRRLGLARKLFDHVAPVHLVTHGAPSLRKLFKKLGLIYDPFVDYKLGVK